ncbi:hypothetical protein [Pseudomonas sp. CGJS7]|uniref:hypothetical protein n=1 Tax=Pseudomonas sp. CGJS7 TaxID=3109348 RepID=UPI00300833C9
MKRFIALSGLLALLAVAPTSAVGQRGVYEEVPYSNNPDRFCRIGYPLHNWVSVAPKLGVWAPVVAKLPVNKRYISTFKRVCMAGGIPMPIGPSAGNKKSRDPAATF